MTPLRRQAEPSFWGRYERRWLYESPGKKATRPLHNWNVRATPALPRKPLAYWFHALVRAEGEPRRCSYCDGPLGLESAETIDHFVPQSACRELALAWDNLYPACTQCNSTYKGARWSCRLVRPDLDPVEDWFEFHAETGRLAPAPELDSGTRRRILLTIRTFQLNATSRCKQRQRFVRELDNALRTRDSGYIVEALTQGPYRFVARKFVAANRKRMPSLV